MCAIENTPSRTPLALGQALEGQPAPPQAQRRGVGLAGANGPFSPGIRVFLFSCPPTSPDFPTSVFGHKNNCFGKDSHQMPRAEPPARGDCAGQASEGGTWADASGPFVQQKDPGWVVCKQPCLGVSMRSCHSLGAGATRYCGQGEPPLHPLFCLAEQFAPHSRGTGGNGLQYVPVGIQASTEVPKAVRQNEASVSF